MTLHSGPVLAVGAWGLRIRVRFGPDTGRRRKRGLVPRRDHDPDLLQSCGQRLPDHDGERGARHAVPVDRSLEWQHPLVLGCRCDEALPGLHWPHQPANGPATPENGTFPRLMTDR